MKKEYSWFEKLQMGLGLKVSRALFHTFTTEERLTELLYPKRYKKNSLRLIDRKKKLYLQAHYVDKNVNKLCNEWKELGFLDKSKPIRIEIENRWGRKQSKTIYWKIMSLNPIYKICKEDRGIEFTEEDKKYLNFLMLSDHVREGILNEFPDEDIVSATLKYYVKNIVMRYNFLLRDMRENKERYDWAEKKAKELNEPTTPEGKMIKASSEKLLKELHKKYGIKAKERKLEFDTLKVVALSNPKTTADHTFIHYLQQLENEYDTVTSTDRKILKALGVYPSDIDMHSLKESIRRFQKNNAT